jgi:16S rRNA (cytidine1402-2'-O)-methyltransferase
VPGASAVIAGLSISGLPTDRFIFEGFLPKGKGRGRYLKGLEDEKRTIILYESPHRLVKTLKDIYDALGNRRIVVCRELTKLYEEIVRGTLLEVIKSFENKRIRGEITIILEGAASPSPSPLCQGGVKGEVKGGEAQDIKKAIEDIIKKEGVSRSEAARIAAKRLGISKKEAYRESLKIEK